MKPSHAYQQTGMILSAFCSILVMLLALTQPSFAGILVGETRAVSTTSDGADAPALAANANGGYLTVWEESGQIWGRHIQADGNPNGTPFQISTNSNPNFSDDSPAVVYNPASNQFLVVYRRSSSDQSSLSVLGRFVGANSSPANDEITITNNLAQVATQFPRLNLALSVDTSTGHFLAIWQALNAWILGQEGFYGVRLDKDSGAIRASIVPLQPPPGIVEGHHPALAFSRERGEFLLAFDSTISTNGLDIVGQTIASDDTDGSGNPVSLNSTLLKSFVINSDGANQTNPQTVYDEDTHKYAVIWKDRRGGGEAIYGNWVVDDTPAATETLLAGSARTAALTYSASQKLLYLSWVSVEANGSRPLLGRYLIPGSAQLASTLGPVFELFTGGGVNTATRPGLVPNSGGNNAQPRALSVWSTNAATPRVLGQALDLTFRFASLQKPIVTAPAKVKVNQEFTYSVQIKASGSYAAKDIEVVDTLPTGVDLVEVTNTTGNCIPSVSSENTTVSCTLNSLAPGATWPIAIKVNPGRLGTIQNSVRVSWSNKGSRVGGFVDKKKTKVVYAGELVLTSLNDGGVMASGAVQPVTWEVVNGLRGVDLKFTVQYSLDNGKTWLLGEELTPPMDTFSFSLDTKVPVPRGNRTKCRLRILGFTAEGMSIGKAVSAQPFRIEVIKLEGPNGGENLVTGKPTTIAWTTHQTAITPVSNTRLEYSVNKGITWKPIVTPDLDGNPGTYDWTPEGLRANTPKALVRVTLLAAGKKVVGRDTSDNPFSIRVVKLTEPLGGENLNGNAPQPIAWETYATVSDVAKVKLQYSLNNGRSWKTIETLPPIPESFNWTIPALAKPVAKARVRVQLYDQAGKRLGSDTSGSFAIQPPAATLLSKRLFQPAR